MSSEETHEERSGADLAQGLLAQIEALKDKLIRLPAEPHVYEQSEALHTELDRLMAAYMRVQLVQKTRKPSSCLMR